MAQPPPGVDTCAKLDTIAKIAIPVPALSAFDPETPASEGSLDPLGLYAVSDDLAISVAPGVRERHRHIRYLTAMAVSAVVCQGFPPETSAADGMSPDLLTYQPREMSGFR